MHIKRLTEPDDSDNGMWILYEEGDLRHPVRLLTDFELRILLREINDQDDTILLPRKGR